MFDLQAPEPLQEQLRFHCPMLAQSNIRLLGLEHPM
jgi:hypothetical protein